MRRRAKFRAWNQIYNKWYNKPFVIGSSGIPFIYHEDNEFKEDYDAINPVMGLDVTEFTGAQDKDGKNIFEGDIVETFTNHPSFRIIGEVEYSTNFASYVIKCPNYGGSIPFLAEAGERRIIKVIGNIFENPEIIQSLKKEEN